MGINEANEAAALRIPSEDHAGTGSAPHAPRVPTDGAGRAGRWWGHHVPGWDTAVTGVVTASPGEFPSFPAPLGGPATPVPSVVASPGHGDHPRVPEPPTRLSSGTKIPAEKVSHPRSRGRCTLPPFSPKLWLCGPVFYLSVFYEISRAWKVGSGRPP